MKSISDMSDCQLKSRRQDLQRTISICKEYLDSTHNTFLGPLGARAEIRRCEKEISQIQVELNRREDASTYTFSIRS